MLVIGWLNALNYLKSKLFVTQLCFRFILCIFSIFSREYNEKASHILLSKIKSSEKILCVNESK